MRVHVGSISTTRMTMAMPQKGGSEELQGEQGVPFGEIGSGHGRELLVAELAEFFLALTHVHALPFSQAGRMHLSWARTELFSTFLFSGTAAHFVVRRQANPTVVVLAWAHGLFELLLGGLYR